MKTAKNGHGEIFSCEENLAFELFERDNTVNLVSVSVVAYIEEHKDGSWHRIEAPLKELFTKTGRKFLVNRIIKRHKELNQP